jgi:hypothetical protein
MPKYVFEVSGKLPADRFLDQVALDTLSLHLVAALAAACPEMGDIDFEPAVEHVFADGFGKDTVARPIHLGT